MRKFCNLKFLPWFYGLTAFGIMLVFSQAISAEERNPYDQPWEKFGVNFGVLLSAVDSSFRIGSGIGLDIEAEELLGLDETNIVFRTDALWRFSKNRRHRLDFSWFSLNRDATTQIFQDITIKGKNNIQITFPTASTIESNFDLDIYELAYSYSIFQDDRIDLAAGAGLYVIPVDYGLRSTRGSLDRGSASITAPLPVINLRMDFALTPTWFIRSRSQAFYLEYDKFAGSILEFQGALEYNPWKHVGIGLGFDAMGITVEADDEDWPGVDFKGKVEFDYIGLQLYGRLFF